MDKIILDPGVGFGKTYENNLEAIDISNDSMNWRAPSCWEPPENQ